MAMENRITRITNAIRARITSLPFEQRLVKLLPRCQRLTMQPHQIEIRPAGPWRNIADGIVFPSYTLDILPFIREATLGAKAQTIRELGLNISMHGKGGLLQVSKIMHNGQRAIEVASLDKGVGIPDLKKLFEESERSQKEASEKDVSYSPGFGMHSNLGTYVICTYPDRLEMESLGQKWIKEKGRNFVTTDDGRVTEGTYFRLLFYY